MSEREQGNLIGSDKVEGTDVYDANNEAIGSIQRVMIDKRSGQVSYAVLAFGGFLGMAEELDPLPWNSLTYDTTLGGYKTSVTEEQLKGAPKYATENDWSWSDRTRLSSVDQYYATGT